MSIDGLGGIQSVDHNNQEASYLRLRTHGYRYRQITPPPEHSVTKLMAGVVVCNMLEIIQLLQVGRKPD